MNVGLCLLGGLNVLALAGAVNLELGGMNLWVCELVASAEVWNGEMHLLVVSLLAMSWLFAWGNVCGTCGASCLPRLCWNSAGVNGAMLV